MLDTWSVRAGAQSAAKGKTPDRAAAYYHFALAHMYEEQVATYGRSELATKAIEEYRAAIDADPTSAYLTSGLAELYAKTGRIRDAVVEAQDIIKHNPNNLEARRLLEESERHPLAHLGEEEERGLEGLTATCERTNICTMNRRECAP